MRLRERSAPAIAAAAVTGLLAGCGATAHHAPTARGASTTHRAHRTPARTRTATSHSRTARSATTPAPPPRRFPPWHRALLRIRHAGSRPQTTRLPSPGTRVFRAEMHALWAAVQRDRPALGLPAFFPAGAYVQVKSIYDARADWQTRLVGDYMLDVRAAHAVLGPRPAAAQLLHVSVPMADAHWIGPGVCDNREGYYEVPNARVVYRAGDGSVRSFGIASMISWRGWWFVVHLGAILRSTSGGVVDDPSTGPGVSVPSSTC